MSISLICAADENSAIGYQNKLLCKLKGDLKYFKEKTTGSVVVMGRKTYQSIGKALPNRTNIILTTDVNYEADDCYIYNDFDSLINDYNQHSEDEVYVIGGSTLYSQFMDYADTIYLTRIHNKFDNADAHFPKMNMDEWKRASYEVRYEDKDNDYDYTFFTYKRKGIK
ncbi:dihydrofolate reductase [Priestia megaterium]